ncbi:tetratricopeptide repeat protein [Candidatus Poribacteria bacterium]|nr:tetratricopeptide repeat protein [Candidatus Poribacteria bacterium]
MRIELIQRKASINSRVRFTLKTGQQISGVLTEIGLDHITLENEDGSITLLAEMIRALELLKDEWKEQYPEDASVELTGPDFQPPIFKKLIEIEARFHAQIQTAEIELKPPDFTFPADELMGWQKTDAAGVWNRIKNQYEYAQKINELSAKFGRIGPITNDLKSLTERFPTSSGLKRHLAYFCSLLGNWREAIQNYREAAISSEKAYDWFNLAVLALKYGKEELACYSLEQVFHHVPILEEPKAWYVYVNLLQKFSNYPALGKLADMTEREISEDEIGVLLETGIYLLKTAGEEEQATEIVQRWIEGQSPKLLALEAFSELDEQPTESYQQVATELSNLVKEREEKIQPRVLPQPQGYIYTYRRNKGFGSLQDLKGNDYFFHRSAIVDEILLNQLNNLTLGNQIPVVFEPTAGPKGPLAIQISLYQTIDELFKLATDYANDGEYPKAIEQIKRVLALNSEYPQAQELHEKWREYARISGVPRGSNSYARAKRAQLIEKNLDKAVQLLHEAIRRNDNVESAIKDLAMLLVQLDRTAEAINLLEQNRKNITDQQSLDNLFVSIYQSAGHHEKAVALLRKKLEHAPNEEKKSQILWQIANAYLKQENYRQAETLLREVLRLRPDNKAAKRNVGFCLIKQERYDEAEKILTEILTPSLDAKTGELLEAIHWAKTTGEAAQIDEIITGTTLSDFSTGELSGFTQFFLNRCQFDGIASDRVKEDDSGQKRYAVSEKNAQHDLERLENIAKQLGTRRAHERSNYYLSAARIYFDVEGDRNLFYRYVCRSFTSKGDATVIQSRHLDAVRTWYVEALSVYDGDRSQRKDEQDAVNALVRFLFSILGGEHIPMPPNTPPIDEAIEAVIARHPQRDKVFDAIDYLVFRSKYAANRILKRLYDKSTLQAIALEYLKNKEISIPDSINDLSDFVHLWDELRRKTSDERRNVSSELRFLNNFELTTAWLENGIKRIKSVEQRLFFDLDRQRIGHLQRILEVGVELCKQVTFEEREHWCRILLDDRCQKLLKEMEENPTQLSIEEIYPVIEALQKKIKARLQELYETSQPQPTLRLAYESYVPDNNQQVEVQVVVANKIGCSPAESLELIIPEDREFFSVGIPAVQLGESLRGGDQRILKISLRLTDHALKSQTFSLALYVQYGTRSGEIHQTPVENLSIRLYSADEFEEIESPYAAYAEGGVVGEPEMFFGREELIQNIAPAIQESRSQSKCVIVFGQKRAGKSSVLHHLKSLLEKERDLLILDLGNIGSILDKHSFVPLLYQILRGILKRLEYAIEDRVDDGFSPLDLSIPSDREFYNHPTPLVLFKDIFDNYKRLVAKREDWCGTRVVLLIDEFSYIYDPIITGKIPESFMKNWKALLQENYFNAVLVGQDVMPKFKQRFPNEFGTTQDERVTYLKQEDAVKLIDEPIRIGGRQGESRYRERAIERILDLTACSPFYIQIICNRLVEYMNRKRARLVTEADVEQVKHELIRGVNALSLDKFDNLINSGDTSKDAIADEDALKVLKAIAVNSKTGPCHRNSIACEIRSPIDIILDDLVKRDVVEREREQYYRIRVGLFNEWLVANG